MELGTASVSLQKFSPRRSSIVVRGEDRVQKSKESEMRYCPIDYWPRHNLDAKSYFDTSVFYNIELAADFSLRHRCVDQLVNPV